MAGAVKPVGGGGFWKGQQMSMSSPAARYCGSNPPSANSASRRNAMLQPAMCSATSSLISTWVGPPGDTATAAGIRLSSGGGKFGPPQAARPEATILPTREVSQSGPATQSLAVEATVVPGAAPPPTLGGRRSP